MSIEVNIQNAIKEARRFLERAQTLQMLLESEEIRSNLTCGAGIPESAAVRRASMDLTKSLAVLRKPWSMQE